MFSPLNKSEVISDFVSLTSNGLSFVELFCGSAEVSRSFFRQGFDICSIDNRRRKGVCEPTLKADINKLLPSDLPFKKVNVVFAAQPCTAFSYGAGNYYYDHNRPKEASEEYIKLFQRTLLLIDKIAPDLWFIENPRGHLRYNTDMTDFLADHKGAIKYLTMGSYGFPSTKPTDIFTNALNWHPRAPLPYGRGAKFQNGDKAFNNMTTVQRQSTPVALADDIASFCFNHFQTLPTAPYYGHSL